VTAYILFELVQLGRFNKEHNYISNLHHLLTQTDNVRLKMVCYYALAKSYDKLNDIEQAHVNYKEAVKLFHQAIQDLIQYRRNTGEASGEFVSSMDEFVAISTSKIQTLSNAQEIQQVQEEIAKADDPEAKQKELEDEYSENFAHPYLAAGRGFIDDVILPSETREKLIKQLEVNQNKVDTVPKKKHDNLPL
jgi:tetratricopeptide (TPR) repeat protein